VEEGECLDLLANPSHRFPMTGLTHPLATAPSPPPRVSGPRRDLSPAVR
jgi:hypothetical protein